MEKMTYGLAGLAISRTITPPIPANFLLRARLFTLFQAQTPGATLVVAPAGYGKSSLVAEWAAQDSRPTFWYTVNSEDSFLEFPTFVLNSIRHTFPEFGKGNKEILSSDPFTAIKAINFEVSQLNQPINFVLDNGRIDNAGIADFAQPIVDLLSENIHLILIRRLTPETSLARYASVGNLSLITSQDLKFSSDEIAKVAKLNGVDIDDEESLRTLDMCEGWPAAVQMLSRNIAQGNHSTGFSTHSSNPLGILALETYNTLLPENQSKLLRLSLLDEFDLESAKIVLGDDYSEAYINKLATDGAFVTISSGMRRTYRFNQIVHDALSQINSSDDPENQSIYSQLAEHFVSINDLTSALHFSFLSGNLVRFTEILRPAIREMAQIGRGDDLIRWSRYSGDGSNEGEVRKLIIKAIGHLVNLEFNKAEAIAEEAQFLATDDADGVARKAQVDLISSFVFFARGEMDRSNEKIKDAIDKTDPSDKARNEDRISLYRLAADLAFIQDDYETVSNYYDLASKLFVDSTWVNSAYQIKCMQAMSLFGEGKFFQAAEAANVAINQASNGQYKGIFGAMDAMVVMARCELEFSHLEKATEIYKQLADTSKGWGIWPWYFLAMGSVLRIEVALGKIESAIAAITDQRKLLSTFSRTNQMGWMIDMSEAFLRYVIEDYERADLLTQRMPKLDMVKQLDFNAEVRKNNNKIESVISKLPEVTPRQQVFKWMSETYAFKDQEHVAIKSLQKAVELGSEVGFRETFVRQNKLYPLFVKISSLHPTFFLETLVRDMTERIQTMNADTGSLEEKLTSRELEILKHLTTGIPISAIAKQLHISQNTMKTHLRNVYRKLSVDGRHSAVEKAQKLLLI